MKTSRPDKWLRRRRLAAIGAATAILALPFVQIGGHSALRFDIPLLTLYAMGSAIPISQFIPVLFVILFISVFFVAITTILGRVWCGWLCPQSMLSDIVEDISKLSPIRYQDLVQRILFLPVSALVSISLIWYFIPPHESLAAIRAGGVAMWFFIVMTLSVYGMLALIGRRFCATICPYSMLQSALFDKDTVVVAFDKAREAECMGCNLCVRVCPMRIDIKAGLQRECVACARCADACARMTSKRGIPTLVRYMGRPVRGKALMLLALALLFGVIALVSLNSRDKAEITLYRNASQPAGAVRTYTYAIRNNTTLPMSLTIASEQPFELTGGGQVGLRIEPNERKTGILSVRLTEGKTAIDRVRFRFSATGVDITKEAGFL